MLTNTEVIILPYAGESNRTILHLLIDEFSSNRWSLFQSAVAFAKQSGNYEELLDAITEFLEDGGIVEMTFGADVFGRDVKGSEYDAVERLLTEFQDQPNARFFLYHEKGSRTFHPKIYLFSNLKTQRALLIVGSSNWSAGGFYDNVEANVCVELDLTKADHLSCYEQLQSYFSDYWQGPE
jgi:HKD family nuclease